MDRGELRATEQLARKKEVIISGFTIFLRQIFLGLLSIRWVKYVERAGT
jgi:hypothetical protein